MKTIDFTLNGKRTSIEVEDNETLLHGREDITEEAEVP
jgi:aerobic-type carbon monoxide dehydrogenase small subunit (CoxS/CutS family)